jgi:hypothetical chaperone protein
MVASPTVYAIDFGTSNSLLAAANAAETFPPIALDPSASDPTVLRSILYFPDSGRAVVGEEALRRYAENGLEGRLLRSLKRHLPSRSFQGTIIRGRLMLFEDLVAVVLREMRDRANAHFGVDVRRAVLGRPARFSSDDADDDLAQRRLQTAAERAGFEEVHFLPEPVAAARDFRAALAAHVDDAHSDGESDAKGVVLVCDFGGGTSDFTVMRLGSDPFVRSDVLAIGGVPLAGDALDASIMRAHVAKNFGAEVVYRVPMGSNVLQMPISIVEQLCSPAHLSVLRRPDIAEFLRNVRGWSLREGDRAKLDQLATLVDDGLGFQIFEAIERAKRTLSVEPVAEMQFEYPGIDVHERIERPSFEGASARAVGAILRCLDETVAASGVSPADIDVVCCTGGTARVPQLASAIAARFGREKMRDFRTFHSVVQGLAHHAQQTAQLPDGAVTA